MPVKAVKSEKLKVKSLKPTTRKAKSSIVKESGMSPRSKGLTVDVFDAKGKAIGKASLPKEIFAAKINDVLMSQAVRVYLANKRKGTASTKGRGDVSLTTAKWYRQKGTGRARHGAKSAPIFVGGGVAHGPVPHDYSLKFPKKMKKASLISALSSKLKDGEIKVVAGLEKITPKTRNVADLIKKLGIENSKMLLITADDEKDVKNVYRASRNIKGVNIKNSKSLNTYEVLDNKMILFMKQAVDSLKENLLKE